MTAGRRTYVLPTRRQRDILQALLETGKLTAAAAKLEISVGTATSQMSRMRKRCGFRSNEQACYVGARDGWLRPAQIV